MEQLKNVRTLTRKCKRFSNANNTNNCKTSRLVKKICADVHELCRLFGVNPVSRILDDDDLRVRKQSLDILSILVTETLKSTDACEAQIRSQ